MKKIYIEENKIKASAVVAGCMRIHSLSEKELDAWVLACLENGIDMFDHADIYGDGKSEEVFARAIKRLKIKDEIILQTKCGIVKETCFNFSKKHILESVEKSLKRLKLSSVDILLLHRPDTLMVPEEIQEAFDILYNAGKVKHFGVSNQTPLTHEFLQSNISYPLKINQLQFSLGHSSMLSHPMEANTPFEGAVNRDGGVLEYCRLKNITVQAWSPFLYGWFEGSFIDNEKFKLLNERLEELAKKYSLTKTGIATSFILTHPANFQVVFGTTKPKRIKEICDASETILTREEWYSLYMAAGNQLI